MAPLGGSEGCLSDSWRSTGRYLQVTTLEATRVIQGRMEEDPGQL